MPSVPGANPVPNTIAWERARVRVPFLQFQCAHGGKDSSEKPAPRTLAWAIYGHLADCPAANAAHPVSPICARIGPEGRKAIAVVVRPRFVIANNHPKVQRTDTGAPRMCRSSGPVGDLATWNHRPTVGATSCWPIRASNKTQSGPRRRWMRFRLQNSIAKQHRSSATRAQNPVVGFHWKLYYTSVPLRQWPNWAGANQFFKLRRLSNCRRRLLSPTENDLRQSPSGDGSYILS